MQDLTISAVLSARLRSNLLLPAAGFTDSDRDLERQARISCQRVGYMLIITTKDGETGYDGKTCPQAVQAATTNEDGVLRHGCIAGWNLLGPLELAGTSRDRILSIIPYISSPMNRRLSIDCY